MGSVGGVSRATTIAGGVGFGEVAEFVLADETSAATAPGFDFEAGVELAAAVVFEDGAGVDPTARAETAVGFGRGVD